jgi:hypothetical protein
MAAMIQIRSPALEQEGNPRVTTSDSTKRPRDQKSSKKSKSGEAQHEVKEERRLYDACADQYFTKEEFRLHLIALSKKLDDESELVPFDVRGANHLFHVVSTAF